LLRKKRVKIEFTQKKKLLGPKCSWTLQFCRSTIWFWK